MQHYLLLILLGFFYCTPAIAEQLPFKVTLGYSQDIFNSSIQVNSTDNVNGMIDFEDELGFDESVKILMTRFDWFVADQHRLTLTVNPVRRDAQRTISGEIEFEGDIIHTGAEIDSEFTNTIYDFEYGYLFSKTEQYDLEITAGLYWMSTQFDLHASGSIENSSGEISFQENYSKKVSQEIPMPLLGLRYRHFFDQDWTFIAAAKYFGATVDNISGAITSATAAVEYKLGNNWETGVSLVYFDIDVDVEKRLFDGNFSWDYSGASAYVTYSF